MGNLFSESFSLEIEAAPQTCFAEMTRFESYPEWQKAVKEVRVLSREGQRVQAEFHVNLIVREIVYTLDYRLEPDVPRIWWTYVEGDAKNVAGEFTFEAVGAERTQATYRLEIDPGIPVPKMLINKIKKRVMRGVVEDLKRRVESA